MLFGAGALLKLAYYALLGAAVVVNVWEIGREVPLVFREAWRRARNESAAYDRLIAYEDEQIRRDAAAKRPKR